MPSGWSWSSYATFHMLTVSDFVLNKSNVSIYSSFASSTYSVKFFNSIRFSNKVKSIYSCSRQASLAPLIFEMNKHLIRSPWMAVFFQPKANSEKKFEIFSLCIQTKIINFNRIKVAILKNSISRSLGSRH